MSLQGKILDISKDGLKAKVLVKPKANCNGCKACAGLIKNSNITNSEIEVYALTNNLSLKTGDLVTVELSDYQGSKAAFLLYGIPIIGFLTGMFISPYFCNLFNISITDLIRVIAAFTGLFLSFVFVYLYMKFMNNNSFLMTITSKVSNSNTQPF